MLKFLMVLRISWLTYQAYIIFDTGQSITLDTDACNTSSTPNSETQSFSGTFQNVPQMFVYTNYFSINNPGTGATMVSVELHNLAVTVHGICFTVLGFTITLSCSGESTKRYHYVWYAFSDTRMTVLSPGMQTIKQGPKVITHSHTNTKATQGFVILTGMKYNGTVNFAITVQSVSSTDVTVYINSNNYNTTALGYFVVVGTEESFSLKGPLNTGPGSVHEIITSQTIKISPKGVLICPTTGFIWNNVDQPRFQSNVYQSGSNIYYTVGTFGDTTMVDIYFNQIWVYYAPYYPMLIDKYSVTRIYYRHPKFNQKVIILGQEFTQIGIYNLQIPDATTSVTIEIYLQHQPQKKISGTFLKCNNCGTQNKYYIQYQYVSVYNFTKFIVYLVQQANYNYKYLTISILSTGISIKQETNLSDDHSTLVNLYFE